MSILKRFYQSVNKLGPFERNATIAVAVSGGSDSLALTLLLNSWARKNHVKLCAITIDHSLRRESATEADKLHEQLSTLSIDHKIIKLPDNLVPKQNTQEIARKFRYEKLCDFCHKYKIYHLFTAHTLNDEVENFFIRLARGTSLKGLSGIRNKIIMDNVRVLRPLLTFTKQELREYLYDNNLSWFEDPSNFNMKFSRAIARKLVNSSDLLKLSNQESNEVLFYRIHKVINEIVLSQKKEERQILNFLVQNVVIFRSGYGECDLSNIKQIDANIAIRALSLLIVTISATGEHQPRYDSLQKLYQNLLEGKLKHCTLGKCYIEYLKERKMLRISPENTMPPEFLYKRYLIKTKSEVKLNYKKLNKKNAPTLPSRIRKIIPEIELSSRKKIIPFIDNEYYNYLLMEFSPQNSLVESTIDN